MNLFQVDTVVTSSGFSTGNVEHVTLHIQCILCIHSELFQLHRKAPVHHKSIIQLTNHRTVYS